MARRDEGATQQQQAAIPKDQQRPRKKPRSEAAEATDAESAPAGKPATIITDWASI